MKLNPKQQRFCEEYVIDLNAFAAAEASGILFEADPQAYYVYLLIDPRDNKIFYIGKGSGKRMHQHMANFRNQKYDNGKKELVISEVWKTGKSICPVIFQNGLPEKEALLIEGLLIRRLMSTPITNIQPGMFSRQETIKTLSKVILDRMLPFDTWRAIRNPSAEEISIYHKMKRELRKLIRDGQPIGLSYNESDRKATLIYE